jgi:hypothetical protein
VRRRAAAVAVLALLGGTALAQSLGEIARREQEKKQAPASPAPTYTQDDLKKKRAKSKGTVSELPATGGARPGPSPSPGAPAETETDRERDEREWRARFARARARVEEADAKAYEDRIEVVFVSGVPVQQKVRVKVETPELVAARQALSDLEEELRVAGGLPGWGRE